MDSKELAKKPNLAVSVDLLTVLFQEQYETNVRLLAMEVYLRRVYRAQSIKSLVVKEEVHTSHISSHHITYHIISCTIVVVLWTLH